MFSLDSQGQGEPTATMVPSPFGVRPLKGAFTLSVKDPSIKSPNTKLVNLGPKSLKFYVKLTFT
jgi:hypothetical protein